MSSSQLRRCECAINSAREAAAGRCDLDTAERVYRGALAADVSRDELRAARRFLAAAARNEGGGAW
jgi:hypothetical protein